jgi:hypothetical protein
MFLIAAIFTASTALSNAIRTHSPNELTGVGTSFSASRFILSLSVASGGGVEEHDKSGRRKRGPYPKTDHKKVDQSTTLLEIH